MCVCYSLHHIILITSSMRPCNIMCYSTWIVSLPSYSEILAFLSNITTIHHFMQWYDVKEWLIKRERLPVQPIKLSVACINSYEDTKVRTSVVLEGFGFFFFGTYTVYSVKNFQEISCCLYVLVMYSLEKFICILSY